MHAPWLYDCYRYAGWLAAMNISANIHRIHRRQHVSEDDAGISKHRLSPYNAYYHN